MPIFAMKVAEAKTVKRRWMGFYRDREGGPIMNGDRRSIETDHHRISITVFLQAIANLTLLPSIELQFISAIGIMIIDVVCIAIAFFCNIPDSKLLWMILLLTVLFWIRICVLP